MATAWLTETADDDLLDLGELSPIAPETRPTTTLEVSPLGEISPVDANRQRVPAVRAGSKPFPFAPSPVVKGTTRSTAALPRSPAFAPSPLAPERAAQREPTKNSPGKLARAGAEIAPAPAPSPIFRPPPLGDSRVAAPTSKPVPKQSLSVVDPPRGGGLSRHSRRQSLGLDAFQSIGKGLLEEDDDFDFAPSFTPKSVKGPGAIAHCRPKRRTMKSRKNRRSPPRRSSKRRGRGKSWRRFRWMWRSSPQRNPRRLLPLRRRRKRGRPSR